MDLSLRWPFLIRPNIVNDPGRLVLHFRVFLDALHGNDVTFHLTEIAHHPVEDLSDAERIADGQANLIWAYAPAGVAGNHGKKSGKEDYEIPREIQTNRYPSKIDNPC